jgi:hypothetical protein
MGYLICIFVESLHALENLRKNFTNDALRESKHRVKKIEETSISTVLS